MRFGDLGFLVVEDHELQREALTGLLKHLGVRCVFAAANGRQALEILDNPQVKLDIVISDLEMPKMDGMEFIRHLGSGEYPVSLIVASAHDRVLLSSVQTMASAYGANLLGVIQKPITAPALSALIVRHSAVPAKKGPVTPVAAPDYTLDEIIDGIENNQFEPFFQPKLAVATHRVVGAEVLARWRHPRHGIVMPSAFIPTLEANDKIDNLMWLMLAKTIASCSLLRSAGFEGVVAVNLSLKSLTDTDLANRIIEIATAHGVEPRNLCFEVTESALTTDVARALENLTRLRMKGFGLSIDDYGTGYSSMQQLTRIPFTELKIDGSFVTNACRHEAAKVVLAASLAMARKLGITAVAEGVESQEDWDLLAELKCDLAQGYFIARPMPIREYLLWHRNLKNDPMTIART